MVVIVMGVAGSGKTTVGALLAEELGWAFVDGDTLHPPENVARMAAGIPLTDEDRLPWLATLKEVLVRSAGEGGDVVLACSALKERYRRILMDGLPQVVLVHLRGDAALLASRLAHRQGHFFPPSLLASQLEALEEPAEAIVLDVAATPAQLVAAIRDALATRRGEGR